MLLLYPFSFYNKSAVKRRVKRRSTLGGLDNEYTSSNVI